MTRSIMIIPQKELREAKMKVLVLKYRVSHELSCSYNCHFWLFDSLIPNTLRLISFFPQV